MKHAGETDTEYQTAFDIPLFTSSGPIEASSLAEPIDLPMAIPLFTSSGPIEAALARGLRVVG